MTTDNFCFYLQNRLIQTSQTGGQWYSDSSPFSIPWFSCWNIVNWDSVTWDSVSVLTESALDIFSYDIGISLRGKFQYQALADNRHKKWEFDASFVPRNKLNLLPDLQKKFLKATNVAWQIEVWKVKKKAVKTWRRWRQNGLENETTLDNIFVAKL